MATKITVALEDDLDGGPAVETVRFAVEGTEYEIDLNKKNAAAFRKQLARMCGGLATIDQVLPRHDALGRGHSILGGQGAAQGPQPVEDA
jgi:Lsr2